MTRAETHSLVNAASVDFQSRVRLGDARQTRFRAEDGQDLDLRDLESPVELREQEKA